MGMGGETALGRCACRLAVAAVKDFTGNCDPTPAKSDPGKARLARRRRLPGLPPATGPMCGGSDRASGWKAPTQGGPPAGTRWRNRQNRVHFRSRIAAGKPAYLDWRELRRRLLPWPAGISLLAEGAQRVRMIGPLRKQAHRCAIQLP